MFEQTAFEVLAYQLVANHSNLQAYPSNPWGDEVDERATCFVGEGEEEIRFLTASGKIYRW